MIRQEDLKQVILSQRISFEKKESGLTREILNHVPKVKSFATIITGIRRCGKSTLMHQLIKGTETLMGKSLFFLNFEDIRLTSFDKNDFIKLYNEIKEVNASALFFDEIQLVDGWEIFINQLLRENYQVFLTGSNASMLSIELGTHLTGRHLSIELFPFSYNEFVRYNQMDIEERSLKLYLKQGGMPEFVIHKIPSILNTLVDDIVVKDIAVRHAIRDVEALKQLVIYLISNTGNLVSASKLVGLFGLKSATTILEFFSYLKDTYLIDFVPMFHESLKVQARNPRKVYVVDTGIFTELAISSSTNEGRRLENLIFLHLRRKSKNIFYYKDMSECDFVVLDKNKVSMLIQVCYHINDENFDREMNGLQDAMRQLKVKKGWIVTMNQSDFFEVKDVGKIIMQPAHEFLTQI